MVVEGVTVVWVMEPEVMVAAKATEAADTAAAKAMEASEDMLAEAMVVVMVIILSQAVSMVIFNINLLVYNAKLLSINVEYNVCENKKKHWMLLYVLRPKPNCLICKNVLISD